MNTFYPVQASIAIRARRPAAVWALVFLAVLCLTASRQARGQAAESADAGRGFITVGGGVSAIDLGYGSRQMLAGTAWADVDTIRKFGFEGEGHFIEFRQTANVHAETYLGGVRYHFNYAHMQPYVKAVAGIGHFNFPYNYATGSYLVVGGGGGVDYRLSRRLGARTEFEYLDWPQFTYGTMSSFGVTLGLRYHVF